MPFDIPKDQFLPCKNPRCPTTTAVPGDLHQSGYCSGCCAQMGPIGCAECGIWDDDDGY